MGLTQQQHMLTFKGSEMNCFNWLVKVECSYYSIQFGKKKKKNELNVKKEKTQC